MWKFSTKGAAKVIFLSICGRYNSKTVNPRMHYVYSRMMAGRLKPQSLKVIEINELMKAYTRYDSNLIVKGCYWYISYMSPPFGFITLYSSLSRTIRAVASCIHSH